MSCPRTWVWNCRTLFSTATIQSLGGRWWSWLAQLFDFLGDEGGQVVHSAVRIDRARNVHADQFVGIHPLVFSVVGIHVIFKCAVWPPQNVEWRCFHREHST